jgi:putative transposase
VVCDGLKGPPEVVSNVWPQTMVPTCIIHLIRNTFRMTSRKYLGRAQAGPAAPAVIRLWESAWEEFSRSWTTTWRSARWSAPPMPIESLNARYRRAIKARGHFPSEQAALKCLYLVTRSPTGTGRTRRAMRWKPALNAFAVTFADRFPAAETY